MKPFEGMLFISLGLIAIIAFILDHREKKAIALARQRGREEAKREQNAKEERWRIEREKREAERAAEEERRLAEQQKRLEELIAAVEHLTITPQNQVPNARTYSDYEKEFVVDNYNPRSKGSIIQVVPIGYKTRTDGRRITWWSQGVGGPPSNEEGRVPFIAKHTIVRLTQNEYTHFCEIQWRYAASESDCLEPWE